MSATVASTCVISRASRTRTTAGNVVSARRIDVHVRRSPTSGPPRPTSSMSGRGTASSRGNSARCGSALTRPRRHAGEKACVSGEGAQHEAVGAGTPAAHSEQLEHTSGTRSRCNHLRSTFGARTLVTPFVYMCGARNALYACTERTLGARTRRTQVADVSRSFPRLHQRASALSALILLDPSPKAHLVSENAMHRARVGHLKIPNTYFRARSKFGSVAFRGAGATTFRQIRALWGRAFARARLGCHAAPQVRANIALVEHTLQKLHELGSANGTLDASLLALPSTKAWGGRGSAPRAVPVGGSPSAKRTRMSERARLPLLCLLSPSRRL